MNKYGQLAVIGAVAMISVIAPQNAQAGGWESVHHHVHKTGRCGPAREVLATYYSIGTKTSTGERFNPHGLTAASHDYPLGTVIEVTNPNTGKTCAVRVNDRGPYGTALRMGTRLDFAVGAARCLGMTGTSYICAPIPLLVPQPAGQETNAQWNLRR